MERLSLTIVCAACLLGGVTTVGAQPEGSQPVPTRDLGLIGVTQIGSRTQAWVVDRRNQQRETVSPGERVFGYTVRKVGPESVVLTRGGRDYTLRLNDRLVVQALAPTRRRSTLHARRRTGAGTVTTDEPVDTAADEAVTDQPAVSVRTLPAPTGSTVNAPRSGSYAPNDLNGPVGYGSAYLPNGYGPYGYGAGYGAGMPPGWSIFQPNGDFGYPYGTYPGPFNGMAADSGPFSPYSATVPGVVPGSTAGAPNVSPVLTPYGGPTPLNPNASIGPAYGGYSGTAPYGLQSNTPPPNWWGGGQTFQDTLGVGGNPQTARRGLGVGTRGGAYSPSGIATPQTLRRRNGR